MSLESTRPLKEIITRHISLGGWGIKATGAYESQPYYLYVKIIRIFWKSQLPGALRT